MHRSLSALLSRSFSGTRAFRLGSALLVLLLAALIGVFVPSQSYAASTPPTSAVESLFYAPPLQEVPSAPLTPELIASVVTILFSLAFAYLPGVKTWYSALESEHKAAIMGLVILLVGAGAFGASCGGFVRLEGISCTQTGVVALVQTVLFALLSSVGSYTLLVKPFRKTDADALSDDD